MAKVDAAPAAPRTSVLVATRDRARLLPGAIASVLAQTDRDLEVIVIDDGSRDDTPARVAALAAADPRVRGVRQEARGVSAALNRGLAEARGAFLARVDSDDVWLPELLAKLHAALADAPEAAVAYGQGEAMDRAGWPLPRWLGARRGGPMPAPDDAYASLLLGDVTCNIAMLARRDAVVEAGGFDESLRAHEDWDLWLRVARRHPKFLFVDRALARYRLHAQALTSPTTEGYREMALSRLRVLDKAFAADAAASRPDLADLEAPARRAALIHAGQRLVHAGHIPAGLSAYAQALATHHPAPADRAHTIARIAWSATSPPALAKAALGLWLRRAPQPG